MKKLKKRDAKKLKKLKKKPLYYMLKKTTLQDSMREQFVENRKFRLH